MQLVYELGGELLARNHDAGSLVEYIYLNGTPLAVYDRDTDADGQGEAVLIPKMWPSVSMQSSWIR